MQQGLQLDDSLDVFFKKCALVNEVLVTNYFLECLRQKDKDKIQKQDINRSSR